MPRTLPITVSFFSGTDRFRQGLSLGVSILDGSSWRREVRPTLARGTVFILLARWGGTGPYRGALLTCRDNRMTWN